MPRIIKRISVLGKLLFALVLLVIPASQAFANGECNGSNLPLGVQHAIQKKFPAWSVVTIDNLDPDSQKLWLEAHSKECPGFVVGNFDGRSVPSYAVSLSRQQGAAQWGMLLVVTKEATGYELHVLARASKVGTISVVSKLPAGSYSGVDEITHIRAAFPVIQYDAIEVGAIIYYWENGRYNSLLVSE